MAVAARSWIGPTQEKSTDFNLIIAYRLLFFHLSGNLRGFLENNSY
jgi:hypothetical protein